MLEREKAAAIHRMVFHSVYNFSAYPIPDGYRYSKEEVDEALKRYWSLLGLLVDKTCDDILKQDDKKSTKVLAAETRRWLTTMFNRLNFSPEEMEILGIPSE